MGAINAENTLTFRSSQELFNRIKETLNSYDNQGMIDESIFYQYVVEVLHNLGAGVMKEDEAVLHVRDHKAKLPCNFKLYYAAYKCTPEWEQGPPSINEQIPWIWYQQNDYHSVCPDACCIECVGHESKTKIVVRTFVNGDSTVFSYRNPILLRLSPNVKDQCVPGCMKTVRPNADEITIKDGWILSPFKKDAIYLKYLGIPMDENFLPMIPDNPNVEKAIEYYIYKMLFEKWFLNDNVLNIGDKLTYVRNDYNFYFKQASYEVNLPSFQRCIQSARRLKGNNQFYNFEFDNTISNGSRGFAGRGYSYWRY